MKFSTAHLLNICSHKWKFCTFRA